MASKKPPKPQRERRPDKGPRRPTPLGLRDVMWRLESVRHARDDYVAAAARWDWPRQMSSMGNFANNGVSVTWALRKALPPGADKDTWLGEWADKLGADPVARYFYWFRTAAIHEGRIEVGFHLRMQDPNEPEHIVTEQSLQGMPSEFDNVPLAELMDHYIAVLTEMVDSAVDRFGPIASWGGLR